MTAYVPAWFFSASFVRLSVLESPSISMSWPSGLWLAVKSDWEDKKKRETNQQKIKRAKRKYSGHKTNTMCQDLVFNYFVHSFLSLTLANVSC